MNASVPRLSRRQVLAAGAVGAAGVAGAGAGVWLLPRLTSTTSPVSAAWPDGAWPSTLGTASGLAAHLLRRAGFGYSDAELDDAASMKYTDLVEKVTSQQPERLPAIANAADYRQVIVAWQRHMATTPAQYPDRVAFFWHGVLTSDFRSAAQQPIVLQQLQMLRMQGRSDLRSLMLAITYDPLMIRYLDLQQSSAAAPNENYARELMELFMLGPGNYTETDVREGARIFSGIRTILVDAAGTPARLPAVPGLTVQQQLARIAQLLAQGYTYRGVMQPRLHDSGTKTFLKNTGNLDPEQAIDILLAQTACAVHITTRALVHFCTPSPSTSLVNSVAAQFRNSKYDITTLMRAIFTSGDFTAAANYRSLVRSPVDYTVATMRALNRPELAATAARAGAGMAQVLYDPPNVAGWPSNAAWIASSTWLARVNFAAQATAHSTLPSPSNARQYLLDGVVGSDTAAAYRAATSDADRWYAVLSSPEFQLK